MTPKNALILRHFAIVALPYIELGAVGKLFSIDKLASAKLFLLSFLNIYYIYKNLLSSSVLNSPDAFSPLPTLVEALTLTSYRLYFSER